MAKRRESRHVQSLRYRSLTVIFCPSSLRFPSYPVAAQEMKVKGKIRGAEYSGTVDEMHSLETKIPGNHIPTRISSKLGERKSKSTEKLLVKVDETSYPCQRSLIIP